MFTDDHTTVFLHTGLGVQSVLLKRLKLLRIDFVSVHNDLKWQQTLKVSNLLVNKLLYLDSVLVLCCHWNTFTVCCDPTCNSNFRTYHTTDMDISNTYLLYHICFYHKFILQCTGTYKYIMNTCTAVDLYFTYLSLLVPVLHDLYLSPW